RAPELPAFPFGNREQVCTVENSLATSDTAAGAHEAHGCKADRGLSGARFSDKPENFAPLQRKADIINDGLPVTAAFSFYHEIPDVEQVGPSVKGRFRFITHFVVRLQCREA